MPRVARRLAPAGFVLAGLCFLLPFATVSCDAPGGFGRAAPGGTTTYTGVDLVIGGAPAVDKPAPVAQQRDDRLGVQPLAVVLAILIVGAGVATAVVSDARARRITALATAATAALLLVANQAATEALLAEQLREQLTGTMPAGKHAADFVHTGQGFGLCLLVLLGVIVGNAITLAWRFWQVRRERRRLAAGSPAAGLPVPVDPWAGSAEGG